MFFKTFIKSHAVIFLLMFFCCAIAIADTDSPLFYINNKTEDVTVHIGDVVKIIVTPACYGKIERSPEKTYGIGKDVFISTRAFVRTGAVDGAQLVKSYEIINSDVGEIRNSYAKFTPTHKGSWPITVTVHRFFVDDKGQKIAAPITTGHCFSTQKLHVI